jgi:hypothetical protein
MLSLDGLTKDKALRAAHTQPHSAGMCSKSSGALRAPYACQRGLACADSRRDKARARHIRVPHPDGSGRAAPLRSARTSAARPRTPGYPLGASRALRRNRTRLRTDEHQQRLAPVSAPSRAKCLPAPSASGYNHPASLFRCRVPAADRSGHRAIKPARCPARNVTIDPPPPPPGPALGLSRPRAPGLDGATLGPPARRVSRFTGPLKQSPFRPVPTPKVRARIRTGRKQSPRFAQPSHVAGLPRKRSTHAFKTTPQKR